MITYHQAFDVYHTSFRILYFMYTQNIKSIEIDRLRIFDFILLFPHDLHNVKMPIGSTAIRKDYQANKYNELPNRKRVFFQIGKYFELAIKCLMSYDFIDIKDYQEGKITLIENVSIEKLVPIFKTSISVQVMNLLKEEFLTISMLELKERTQLIEYRYDLSKA